MQDYLELEDVLDMAHAAVSAAECHGFLTGQLCSVAEVDENLWQEFLDLRSADDAAVEDCYRYVRDVMDEGRRRIWGDEFEFQLLMPDDDTGLDERVAALAGWCHGFLTGFGLAPGMPARMLSADVQEWLSDMDMIARAAVGNPEEDDETALVHVQEHVRAGVMLIVEELRASADADPGEVMH